MVAGPGQVSRFRQFDRDLPYTIGAFCTNRHEVVIGLMSATLLRPE